MRIVSILIFISCLLFAGCKKSVDEEDVNEVEVRQNYEDYVKLLRDHNRPRYDYFPAGIFDANDEYDKFVNLWYGDMLAALGEPSFYAQRDDRDKKIFRFTWLRTFHRPISIRLERREDGTGLLYCRVTNGAGGYVPGTIMKSYEKEIGKENMNEFLELINKHKFWDMPTKTDPMGLDGAQWIIEGLSDGRYHIVDRWSPEAGTWNADGKGIMEMGLLLLKFSELVVTEIY